MSWVVEAVPADQVDQLWPRQLEWDNSAIAAGGVHACCNLCGAQGLMIIEHPVLRETVRCQSCGSFARQRALAHLVQEFLRRRRHAHPLRVLLLESTGALYRGLRTLQATGDAGPFTLVAAEYEAGRMDADAAPDSPGHIAGVDLCAVPADVAPCFDVVLHADVLEHVVDPREALAGTARLLRRGGVSLFTAPLDGPDGRHRVRSRLTDGSREDVLPPVYHGDPNPGASDSSGVLVWNDLGLHELSEQAQSVGLGLTTHRLWSYTAGVLGQGHVVMELALRQRSEGH